MSGALEALGTEEADPSPALRSKEVQIVPPKGEEARDRPQCCSRPDCIL